MESSRFNYNMFVIIKKNLSFKKKLLHLKHCSSKSPSDLTSLRLLADFYSFLLISHFKSFFLAHTLTNEFPSRQQGTMGNQKQGGGSWREKGLQIKVPCFSLEGGAQRGRLGEEVKRPEFPPDPSAAMKLEFHICTATAFRFAELKKERAESVSLTLQGQKDDHDKTSAMLPKYLCQFLK